MIELRYPIDEDAEAFFGILTEGNFEYYHAAIPVSIDSEKEWIKSRTYKREKNLEFNYSIIYNNTVAGGCNIRIYQDSLISGSWDILLEENISIKESHPRR